VAARGAALPARRVGAAPRRGAGAARALAALAARAGRAASPAAPVAAVAVAAALRLPGIGAGRPDPYYDAAVRSMGTSWHAFLVGAFEPGARVAIDKPPGWHSR
jgi:hypothetical protein